MGWVVFFVFNLLTLVSLIKLNLFSLRHMIVILKLILMNLIFIDAK